MSSCATRVRASSPIVLLRVRRYEVRLGFYFSFICDQAKRSSSVLPESRMVLDSLLPELNAQSATLALVLDFSAISLPLGVRGVRAAACPEVPACAIGEAVPCETPAEPSTARRDAASGGRDAAAARAALQGICVGRRVVQAVRPACACTGRPLPHRLPGWTCLAARA